MPTHNHEMLVNAASEMDPREREITFGVLCAGAAALRQQHGRDTVLRAGCIEDILSFAVAAFGDKGEWLVEKLTADILGHDDTDDVLAGIWAASEAVAE
jgi:hypothetical protein